MSSLVRIPLAVGVLCGLLLFGFAGRAPANRGAMPVVESLSCDAAQPLSGDFDKNGVADSVSLSNRSGRDALHVVLNGRHQELLEAASTCRFGVLDVDHDSDVDLVALSKQGDLEIWGNEDGAFRRLRPESRSTPATLGSTLRPWATALDANSVTSRSVVLVEPPDPKYGRPADRSCRTCDGGFLQNVWRDQSLARPPPAS
jgi:hypothetical protein